MNTVKKRSPLLTEEDWWTVWFGLSILAIATLLGILAQGGAISAVKVPKLGQWNGNPADTFHAPRR